MIFVVCANPALDRMLVLEEVALNEVNRAKDVSVTVGGKGVNVARAIRTVGGEAKLLLFLGGKTGESIKESLERECFSFSAWFLQDETRITTVLHETRIKRHTVINESGPLVPLVASGKLLRYLEEALQEGDYLVLSGSLPRGMRLDFYALSVEVARKKRAWAVVDASGESLRRALQNHPFMVKPNVREAEEVTGFPILSLADKLRAVEFFEAQGVECVVLSDGPRGVVAGWRGKRWYIGLREPFYGEYFIGSGDTLVGAMVARLTQGASFLEALRFGASCGLANTFSPGAGVFDPGMIPECERVIFVEPIS